MLGTAVNLTWRQVGSCRPFCKLQVCVRDDREVRDESCRSFTRNFGGAIFWCWVWLRWNNAKIMILKTLSESNILFKETHFLHGEQTRVSAWLVLRNFFSALRSGRNVQEAFEQPVCFSALSSLVHSHHPDGLNMESPTLVILWLHQICCPLSTRPVVVWPLCSMLLAQHNRLMLAPFCCFLKAWLMNNVSSLRVSPSNTFWFFSLAEQVRIVSKLHQVLLWQWWYRD